MYKKTNNNIQRKILLTLGVLLYRCRMANFIIGLTPGRVRAVLYHAVEDFESNYTHGLGTSVSPYMFDKNLEYFKKYYNVVPVSSLGDANLPDSSLVITFDDGYTTIKENAWPALRKHKLPACVYLISRAVQNRLVWVNQLTWAMVKYPKECFDVFDTIPEFAHYQHPSQVLYHVQDRFSPTQVDTLIARLEEKIEFEQDHRLYLNAEEIKEMSRDRFEFGFHTRDHYNLKNCDQATLNQQLDNSDVVDLMNNRTFAYPFGLFDTQAIRSISSKGYQCLMTVGNNNNRFSARHLDRIEINTADPAIAFAQLEVVEPVISWLRRCLFKLKLKPESTVAEGQTNS